MGWVEQFPGSNVKLIGAAEVLGAIGLILPLVTGIAPVLAPIAAVALAILMIGAVVTHIKRKESAAFQIVLVVVLLVSAVLGFLFVA
jgi:VIT1/CCC1 family predicted Fe2+/Mn2+ transporter